MFVQSNTLAHPHNPFVFPMPQAEINEEADRVLAAFASEVQAVGEIVGKPTGTVSNIS